jgi:hypothetical protein
MRRDRAFALAVLVVLLGGRPASAQGHVIASAPRVDPAPGALTNFNFHLDAAFLSIDDPRFSWDADFGGDVDLIDFGRGRINFLANYEAILGSPLKSTDPNQGNYTLDGSVSWRVGRNELSGVFHHVSRHLSDRAKAFPIDWNAIGVAFGRTTEASRWRVDTQARTLRAVKTSFVDYEWELWGQVSAEYRLGERARAVVRGHVSLVTVDPTVTDRGAQRGAGFEAAVRLLGRQAAVEFVVGVERRIDADPIERQPQAWMMMGFRLTNR